MCRQTRKKTPFEENKRRVLTLKKKVYYHENKFNKREILLKTMSITLLSLSHCDISGKSVIQQMI